MGRRRVLVLAPAITRMQCMNNPYKRVKDGSGEGEEREVGEGGAVKRRGSFWSSWRKRSAGRKKKTSRGGSKGGEPGRRRRTWGFRVSKLTIRMLSPGYWLKKLRDSYINLMLALERNAPMECSGMVTYPSHTAHHQYPGAGGGGGAGGGAWVWPTLTPPVVF
ncbi:hypothetical protein KC19_1G182600 [Ceratodon purpureus]|uniref:Uncharacterized protein n=1 Tax=Ceratodon purpureus TaxID=3225 RepID=A0A8T0J9X7_CERPU|nr:hypothetical protein KC19_1G182600 [Ceratodon purpureus]